MRFTRFTYLGAGLGGAGWVAGAAGAELVTTGGGGRAGLFTCAYVSCWW